MKGPWLSYPASAATHHPAHAVLQMQTPAEQPPPGDRPSLTPSKRLASLAAIAAVLPPETLTGALPFIGEPFPYYPSHPLRQLTRLFEPTSYQARHDPRRPKTAADLAAIEAAREKREAKARRRAERPK